MTTPWERPIDCSDSRDWRCLWRGAQAPQRGAIAVLHFLLARMAPLSHDMRASHEDVAQALRAAAEHRPPQYRGGREGFEVRRRGVEHDEVGAAAGLDRSGGLRERARAAFRRIAPQIRGHIGELLGSRDVAHALAQALAVLERAQLLEGTHRHVAVAADAPRRARLEPRLEFEDAIAQVRFGHGAQADRGAGSEEPSHLELGWVGP